MQAARALRTHASIPQRLLKLNLSTLGVVANCSLESQKEEGPRDILRLTKQEMCSKSGHDQ